MEYAVVRECILDWAYLFHWAYAEDFLRAVGMKGRNKALEYNLPYLVKKKKLKRRRFGKKFIYATAGTKRVGDYAIMHGLRCTEAILRFHYSKDGAYVSEKEFRTLKFDPIPEFAVQYEGEKPVALLFEYSTKDNFKRKKVIADKLDKYKLLNQFRDYLNAEPYLVYVIDAHEEEVERFATRYAFNNNFYFTDARSFFEAEWGEQLSSSIYIWRGQKVSLNA